MVSVNTTGAALEIMWDVILSFYIIRSAFHYFTVTFFCSLPLAGSSLILTYPILDLTQRQCRTVALAMFVGIIITAAEYSMRTYKVPPQVFFRLSIGLLGAVFLLGGEVALWTILSKRWDIWREWYQQIDYTTLSLLGIMATLVALMPALLILVEGPEAISFFNTSDISEEQSKC